MAIKKGLSLEEAFKALNGRMAVKESLPKTRFPAFEDLKKGKVFTAYFGNHENMDVSYNPETFTLIETYYDPDEVFRIKNVKSQADFEAAIRRDIDGRITWEEKKPIKESLGKVMQASPEDIGIFPEYFYDELSDIDFDIFKTRYGKLPKKDLMIVKVFLLDEESNGELNIDAEQYGFQLANGDFIFRRANHNIGPAFVLCKNYKSMLNYLFKGYRTDTVDAPSMIEDSPTVKESVDADFTSVAAFNSPTVFADIIAKKIMLEMKFEDIGDGHGQGFGCIVADPLKEGTALLYEAISNGVLVLRKLDVAQFKKVLELYSRGASLEVIEIKSKKYKGDDKIFDPYYVQLVNLKNVRRSDPGIEVVPFEAYVEQAEQDDE